MNDVMSSGRAKPPSPAAATAVLNARPAHAGQARHLRMTGSICRSGCIGFRHAELLGRAGRSRDQDALARWARASRMRNQASHGPDEARSSRRVKPATARSGEAARRALGRVREERGAQSRGDNGRRCSLEVREEGARRQVSHHEHAAGWRRHAVNTHGLAAVRPRGTFGAVDGMLSHRHRRGTVHHPRGGSGHRMARRRRCELQRPDRDRRESMQGQRKKREQEKLGSEPSGKVSLRACRPPSCM